MTTACAACIILLIQQHHAHHHYAPDHTPAWKVVLAFMSVMVALAVVSAIFDWWSRD